MASTSINVGRFTADTSRSDKVVFTARPDMRIVKASFVPLALVLGLGVVLYLLRLPIDHDIHIGASAFIVGVGLVGMGCVAVVYEGLSKAVYRLTNDHLEEEYGIIYKRLRRIPLCYMRDVTCTQNVAQRVFGLSSVVVSPTNGDKIVLANISATEDAQEIIWREMLQKSASTGTK